MPAIFSKNCVLMGELDYYCLACCAYLSSEDDVLTHIQKHTHKDKQTSIGYFEKYKYDLIRKVNGVYFCEVCNITIPTATKVDIHVKQEAHNLSKKGLLLKRVGDHVVFDGKVLIPDSAWHGLVENTCVLCNVEFDDLSTHKNLKSHIINVINNKVVHQRSEENKYLYRKVDDVYQCLTCNKLVSVLGDHLNNEEHKQAYATCIIPEENISSKEGLIEEKDVITQETIDKDCKSVIIDGNPKIATGIKNEPEIDVSPISIPTNIEKFAIRHALIVKDNTVYCNMCGTSVPATLLNIKKHVTSSLHKNKGHKKSTPTKKDSPKDIAKVKFDVYAKVAEIVDTLDDSYIIINEKLCFKTAFFLGFRKFNSKVICQFCDIDLIPEHVLSHLTSQQHRELLENALIFSSLGNEEFVRQIKSDLYQCSYCAHVESDYDDMVDHLATTEHKDCKDYFQRKLIEMKLTEANMHRVNYLREMLMMQNFLNMRFFNVL